MKKILDLLKKYDEVWFWINEDVQEQFYAELNQIGAMFLNGKPILLEDIRHCMGISKDFSVGYISNLVWSKTFSSGTTAIKVNYKKYVSGEEDYIYTKPNTYPISIEE